MVFYSMPSMDNVWRKFEKFTKISVQGVSTRRKEGNMSDQKHTVEAGCYFKVLHNP